MSENVTPANDPIIFHDGVLVDTVSPLRTNHRLGVDELFRVDYFGRGIAVAYAAQLRVMGGAA
ncbi:hypothetical protein QM716_28310 [Rhodococcus sp. IEGM 1409]|uniref:hypothetical protein n=1 Tax=Rhodococcus sp. IEGM 1409 TaxID=3047082 RepID=UPI0024B642F9|nr:hypothetical protein [Rhodococcus sp. IEGM 1409]MDI9903773.1 hypothetical protein [Rhodococcus sp. IEGM 1409]